MVATGPAFHAAIAPSSVDHRKIAAVPAPAMRKSFVDGFAVTPVGTP